METFILKNMTDFVLEQANKTTYTEDFYQPVVNYAHFLKKPLKLGYFIPCDENDVPLEEPKELNFKNDDDLEDYCFKYSIAKQRVLFEYQWEFKSWDSSDMENSRIEDLLSDELTYILTETAIKEIGIL